MEDVISDPGERELLAGRTMVVKKLAALPIEAVVRGYLIGSGFKDYQKSGAICGIALPPGLAMAQQLPETDFYTGLQSAGRTSRREHRFR